MLFYYSFLLPYVLDFVATFSPGQLMNAYGCTPSTEMLRLLKLFSWPRAEPCTLGLPTPCSSPSLPHIGNEATFNHLTK